MLPVRSLDQSIAFYTKLGFSVEQRRDDWGWAMLACGDCRIMIDRSINTRPDAERNAVLYFYPDDIRAYHSMVRATGLPIPDLDTTFYGLTEFRLDDPDGNRMWIGQRGNDAR
jgi:catechol 2,3-dioxygenase-like lactoylglutathione lyase family enzyme